MKFGSVCSGIEAASVAWHPLGWSAAWLAEIEKFPSDVLAHHYPAVPNLGDMTKIARKVLSEEVDAPDVLVGGTPCQAFSVAGLREGLADERGQLTIKFVELANAIDFIRARRGARPAIIVWENVPGVLSSKDNAFGCFLAGLAGEDDEIKPPGEKWANAGCVYGPQRTIAWRILDAQYFGVAQRRRRVFVVASARNDFDPTKVLFEFEGVRRDSAPSREAGQIVAALTANGVGTCGADDNQAQAGHLRPVGYRMVAFGEYANDNTASTMKARDYKDATDLAVSAVPLNIYGGNKRKDRPDGGFYVKMNEDTSKTLDASTGLNPTCSQGGTAVLSGCDHLSVRRLTPTECERLQGFPDGYTRLNDKTPDGHRYKALGNSMAVPVMAWIGRRIQLANDNSSSEVAA